MAKIAVPRKIENELKSASQKLGLSEEDLLLNAILYYLQALKDKVELKKELEIWEKTSEADLLKFEEKT